MASIAHIWHHGYINAVPSVPPNKTLAWETRQKQWKQKRKRTTKAGFEPATPFYKTRSSVFYRSTQHVLDHAMYSFTLPVQYLASESTKLRLLWGKYSSTRAQEYTSKIENWKRWKSHSSDCSSSVARWVNRVLAGSIRVFSLRLSVINTI